MNISAIQKMTLLDYPGKVAATIFLAGCNMRCPFCHNPDLVFPDRIKDCMIPKQNLLEFLSKRRGKLDGICISGGEPTLHSDLPELIYEIRQMGFLVKLDTNGTNSQMLNQLILNGMIDYVAMDIKNCPSRYQETCGGANVLEQVQKSIDLLISGTIEYEFRTTIVSPLHDKEAMKQIGKWIKGAKNYYLQPFVDSGNLVGQGMKALSDKEIKEIYQTILTYIPNTHIRNM